MMAGRCLSTEEVISIICGDTEADNEESDCCSEDLISEEDLHYFIQGSKIVTLIFS